ncbi:class I SAM-dependent methyltransferase [Bhargavaea cecembensis]|uniref:class I SAM-dependent methyltransferase n=1 Tax=Bhargavaea cecembensis TaxID=394098 RepID=UPI00058BFDB5|nr:class I SAM-dependent methyltransferase [Bhargavaea cecembensis]
MNEHDMDRLLGIRTAGVQDWGVRSIHDNRYEATPYEALDALLDNCPIGRRDGIVDYGSGKGRVAFYLNHRTGASVTGIEMDGSLYLQSLGNRDAYMIKKKTRLKGSVSFLNCRAEDYRVKGLDTVFFYFNPFSVSLFAKTISRILQSAEERPRPVSVLLYYPTLDYLSFMEHHTPFVHALDLPIPGLSENNPNERFSIWKIADCST